VKEITCIDDYTQVAELKINRVLRGTLSGNVNLRSSYSTWDLLLPGDWQAENVEMIFFLPELAESVGEDVSAYPISYAIRLNNRPLGHALTRKLHRLVNARQILEYTEDVISHLDGTAPKRIYVTPAYGLNVSTDRRFNRWVRVRVPDTAPVEVVARQWIHSQDPKIRAQGIELLRGFQNDENTEILQAMIFDNSFSVYETGEVEFRHYEVREAAYQALRSWKVQVEQPVTREEHVVEAGSF
jgi:hypothetical protein